jgi:repressor LexA
MAKFCDMLSYLRKRENLSQAEFAHRTGLTRSAVSMYETGKREPDFETLELIADFFNVDMDFLTGRSDVRSRSSLPANIVPLPKMKKVPLLGTIACGTPILAAENFDGEVDIPENIHADFALRCKGDSMINARIFDGDIVYIKQCDIVEDGKIAAVLIEDEATLKRVRLYDDHVVLEPENPLYRPMVFWGEEANKVHVLGRAIAFTSSVR